MQFKSFMGYNRRPNPLGKAYPPIGFPRDDPVNKQLYNLFGPEWTPYFQWREMVMGVAFLVLLLVMKELGKKGGCGPYCRLTSCERHLLSVFLFVVFLGLSWSSSSTLCPWCRVLLTHPPPPGVVVSALN